VALLASAAWAQTAGEGGGSDKPRLATFNFRNDTGIDSYASACSSATNALLLTLRQLGIYDVLPSEAGSAKLNEGSLRAWSAAHSADYLMYGSLSGTEDGNVICSLSIFDRAKGKVTISEKSEPVGPMDIFDSVDELIASVLKTATGRHIGFGTIAFAPTGAKGSYSVSLDGISVGSDAASIGTILIGPHTVTIAQKRMLGETVLALQSLEVEEGQTQTISFEIPAVLPEEKKKLDELEAEIHSSWDDPEKAPQTSADVAQYARLTSDISYSAALEPSRTKARQLEAEWAIRKNRNEIEASAWKPSPELLDPSIVIYLTAGGYPNPERLTAATRDNAAFLAILLELKAGAALQKGAYGEALSALEGILDFSRFLPEERKSDYAYGASELKGLLASSGGGNIQTQLKAVFGGQMKTGAAFYAQEGKTPATYRSVLAQVPAPGQFGQRIETAKGGAQNAKAGLAWGTFSFDWLPPDSLVSYNGRGVTLTQADDGRRVSGAYPPRTYPIDIECAGYQYTVKVEVQPGTEHRVEAPVAFLTKAYTRYRQQVISSRTTKIVAGLTFLCAGVVGIGGAYRLGEEAKSLNASLQTATGSDASAMSSRLSEISNFPTLCLIGGGCGVIFGGLMLASVPSQAKINSSIEEIDRQIQKLKGPQ
jgi:hypothetical protein